MNDPMKKKPVAKVATQSINMEPIADRIVVRRDAAEEVTPGGIVMPDLAREKPRMGTVLAVGPGLPMSALGNHFNVDPTLGTTGGAVEVPRVKMQVEVGDRVVISHYAETVTFGSEEVLILRETEVLAILRG